MTEKKTAFEYFDELLEIHTTENTIQTKYSRLRILLEKVTKDLTRKESIQFSNLFSRLSFACEKQSLPKDNCENMIIPIGLNADSGKEITFSSEAQNLPSGIKVFLEDKLTNTFTRLDEANSDYKITLTENTNGIGRFYLHTKSSVLNVDDVIVENISIYKTDNSNLRIVGIPQGKSDIKIFTILGKEVLNSSFTSTGVQNITLPKVATGVYIVHLETETGTLNKKITLE